jgi:alanine-glyoxylate transaminase/serine-glyoxylate transaminase/serine-pyruvate transaminase
VASRSAIEKLREESISGYFADLRNWSDLMNKFLAGGGGYFATPPIGTVFSIQKSMALIRSETIEARIRRHEVCSQAFRAGISHMGLEILASEKLRSNTVTGVIVDGIDIPDFLQRCMKKGVEFGAGVHPAFRDRYFRVGHMGWVKPEHIITALNVIESSLEEIGKEVGHGSALAAEEVFSKHHEI